MNNGAKLLIFNGIGLAVVAGALAFAWPSDSPLLAAAEPSARKAPVETVAAKPAANQPLPVASASPAAEDHFVIKRVLPIKGPIKYGEWHWDDAGVPDGPIVVTVDLDARVLSIFRGGHEIGAAAVLLGTPDHPTPTGVYPITQKKRHHVSNLYDAPMPYMQRLTDDGITLHATQVEWGYASHGCIGMPEAFAAKLFASTEIGDKVYVTRGKMVGVGDSLAES